LKTRQNSGLTVHELRRLALRFYVHWGTKQLKQQTTQAKFHGKCAKISHGEIQQHLVILPTEDSSTPAIKFDTRSFLSEGDQGILIKATAI